MLLGVSVLLSYLLGSISFSYLLAHVMKGIDIREHGSGNAGATNTLRVVGKGPAVLVFLLDMIKGMASVGLGYLFGGDPLTMMSCGVAAIVGHNWPIFLKFRGGKGIATTVGVASLLMFKGLLIAGILAIIVIFTTRYVSLGSLILASGLPIFAALLGYPAPYAWLGVIITLLAIQRHSDNIRRLLAGKERRI